MPARPPFSPVRRPRGRPRKFGRESRAVTLTLPEDTIHRLAQSDVDLGRAIVALAEGASRAGNRSHPPAEIVAYGRHAVIFVAPVPPLRKMRGVELIPVGRHRALISLAPPLTVPRLELEIRDVLEAGGLTAAERAALEGVVTILREARTSEHYALAERTVIVLEGRRQRATVR
jgi:hypothetical protein